eukprot:67365_1
MKGIFWLSDFGNRADKMKLILCHLSNNPTITNKNSDGKSKDVECLFYSSTRHEHLSLAASLHAGGSHHFLQPFCYTTHPCSFEDQAFPLLAITGVRQSLQLTCY